MDFKAKYTSEAEKEKPENKDKIVLNNDAYALIEAMYAVAEELRKTRAHG